MLRVIACVASVAGALFLAAPAHAAGKGGGGSANSSSIDLVIPSTSTLTAAAVTGPHYGDFVTFAVSTPALYPYVNLNCYQGGALVSETWEGWFDGALADRMLGLYSPVWTGGAADCTATLVDYAGGRWKPLVSTSFHVES